MKTNKVMTITNTLPFTCYSFDAVFEAIQPYLKEGFKFDLETNLGYPQQIGVISTFAIQEYRTEDIPEDATEEETAALQQAIQQIPVVKLENTSRRAKAAKG